MMLKVLFITLFVFCAFSTGFERITGGTTASITDYPYTVSIHHKGRCICGGALISPKYVLTSARCTYFAIADHLSVRAGSSLREDGGFLETVHAFAVHPSYNKLTNDYDLAILQMGENFPIFDDIEPVGLPTNSSDYLLGFPGNITGWGALNSSGALADELQTIEMHVMEDENCYFSDVLTGRQFCAGVISNNAAGPCDRDYGDPLVIDGALVGILSEVIGCGLRQYHALFTDIYTFNTWITNVTGIVP